MKKTQLIQKSFWLLFLVFVACSKKDSAPVPPANRAPTITIAPEVYGLVSERLSISAVVVDPDNEPITISTSGLPPTLTFIKDSMRIIGTPVMADTGIRTIRITANDGKATTEVNFILRIFANAVGQKQFLLLRQLQSAISTTTPSLPGVSLTVINEKSEVYAVATGSRIVGQPNFALLPENPFRIASATKPMIAAVILKLTEQGKIDLDKPINQYISNALPNASAITIRQLLSHTSGLYDHLNANSFWSHPNNTATKVWSIDELISLGNAAGALFVAGSRYAYSNTGYVVLGKVIEEVTGKPIEIALKELLFNPIGMPSAFYDNSPTVPNTIVNLATNPRSYEYSPTAAGPAGAVVANTNDLARFGRAIYGASYLSAGTVQQMITNIGQPLGGQSYGLGTRLWVLNGIDHHGHTGAFMDYRSIVIYIPAKKMTMAMMTHGVHANWFTLVDTMMLYALDKL